MRHRWRLTLLVAILIGAIANSVVRWREQRSDAAVVDWLQAHAVPLRTIDPHADLSDLDALGALIGKARVVGVGEATHGTREHFQYKHRLLRYLVTEKGFRAIAFESPWPTGIALNEYVLGGEGDPARLLGRAVFGIWHTEEVLDMVRWMREYNSSVPLDQRVEFVGIDMQLTRDAARAVRDYLGRVDPEFLESKRHALDVLVEKEMEQMYLVFDRNEIRAKSTGETRTISATVREILARFDSRRDPYIAQSTANDFETARQHARILVQQADVCEDANPDDRDRYMAENVNWYLSKHPANRIMIWAHNGHVAFVPSPKAPDLGQHLKNRYGDAYVSIGFVLGSGAYRALDAREIPAARARFATFTFEPGRRTLNALMKTTGLPIFAVDVRQARQARHPLVNREFRIREGYGVVVKTGRNPLVTIKRSLSATHDILIFIEPTTPARGLSRPRK